jgi:predicted transcriptional regulator of viral defense system
MGTTGYTVPALRGISGSSREELARVVGRGRRLVTVDDVAEVLDLDRTSAAKRLARWNEHGWLRRVRRGLYIPVPVDAENPRAWSEDPLVLADAVWRPCYFTGWTAASHWGLTEQVFRTTIVKTTERVRKTRDFLLDWEFKVAHTSADEIAWGLVRVWRGDRRVLFADPARTVVDVLADPSLAGGIRLGAEILDAYLLEHDSRTLVEYGDRLGNGAVFKRLGYLVEAAGLPDDGLTDACRERLTTGIALVDPGGPSTGPRRGDWQIRENVTVGRAVPS